MIKTIFLDLDDVCNMFMEYALKWLGVAQPEGGSWGYDLSSLVSMDSKELWERLGFNFWRSIPESKEFKWLLKWCRNLVGKDNVVILTRVPPYGIDQCVAGKIAWIEEHFDSDQYYLIGNCKEPCANNEVLLIDDSEINVNDFREHSGEAILVPRPWNYLGCDDNSNLLRLILDEYRFQLPLKIGKVIVT